MSLRHATRALVFIAGLSLMSSASLAAAASHSAAPATAALDSFPNAPDVVLFPPHPCIQNEVTLFVRGYVSTPCDSFIRAYRSGDREITIRTLTRTDRECPVAANMFFAEPISFGLLPAGPIAIAIHRHQITSNGVTIDSTVTDTEVSFSVADICPDLLPVPVTSLPLVDSVATVPSPACPELPVTVRLGGHFDSGCGRVISAGFSDGIQLVLAPYPPAPGPCRALIGPWSALVSIGRMLPGSYSVLVHETIKGTNDVWPPVPDVQGLGRFDFTVAQHCDSVPPSQTLPPYVDFLRAGPADSSGTICPNSPIRLSMGGVFPDVCHQIRRIDVAYPTAAPVALPLVQVWIESCPESIACYQTPTPWDTSVVIAGLPPGAYSQAVSFAFTDCTRPFPADTIYTTRVTFQVTPGESCGVTPPPPPGGCLTASWDPGIGGCNAALGQDATGSLSLRVSTGVALSGLQGELRFVEPGGLLITALNPIGPAASMRLSWTPTASGARFVLFAEHGAPIPAFTPQPVPVLDVHVGPAPLRGLPWPADGFHLEAVVPLGSDVNGVEVPTCPTFAVARVIAHLCFEQACDFDGNGVADVRDLVRMVHCVNGDGPCPPDSGKAFDCDGDSLFTLSDVLCCAMNLLRGPDCVDCPIDSTRLDESVRASFDAPISTGQGLDVPLHVQGAAHLGAARLAFRFPADRFTFTGAELHDEAWLELHQPGNGQADVGLIRIAPNLPVAADRGAMDLVLHLALKPGASVGGDIAVASSAFSGPDGVMLRVDLGASPRSLDGRAELAVGPIRPNPSPAAFRISLELTAPARIDVAVHDIAGRRVATLLKGDQPAGVKDVIWSGRTDDGVALHGGVYFLRATVNGRATVKKLVLLGANPGGRQAMP